jgi:hypothetical protein
MPISKFEDYKLFVQPGLINNGGSLLNVPLANFSQSLSSSLVDNYSAPINFNFMFNFDERYYSSCKVNVNGFLVLGNSTPNIASVQNNTLNQAIDQPIICPWWDALKTTEDWQPAPTNGGVWVYTGSYGLDGHMIFCARWYCNSYNNTTGNKKIVFEAILHEKSNTIEFNYQPSHDISASAGTSTATIGISAVSSSFGGTRFRSAGDSTGQGGGPDYFLGGSTTTSIDTLSVVGYWPAGPLSASLYPQKRYIFIPKEKDFKLF